MIDSSSYLNGQYLIVNDINNLPELSKLPFTRTIFWNNLTIFADVLLPITQVSSEAIDIIVIGFLVHHEYPCLTNEDLLSSIVNKSITAEGIIVGLNDYGGRFVVLIKDKLTIVAVTDCCATRQLYWVNNSNRLVLSSSARLILDVLGQKPAFDDITAELMANPVYGRSEYPWYGDTWYDKSINKILANHYLDLKSLTVHRTMNHYTGPTNYADIVDYATNILKGLIAAVHSRYQIIQPLTAGHDSRLVLAASKNHCNNTRYYIFDNNHGLNKFPDVKIATELAKKFGLNLSVIIPGNLRDDFMTEYNKKCYTPKVLSKAKQIQWHFDFHRKQQVLNVSGKCGEVARCFYQYKAGSRDDLSHLIRIAGFNGFFAPQIRSWYADVNKYCRTSSSNVYDLFYWEQRMSNWGATFPFDQDIAIEEFTPYNHKNLLLALLKVPINRRKGPHYLLFKDLVQQLWPETLSLPFNPIIGFRVYSRVKRFIKQII